MVIIWSPVWSSGLSCYPHPHPNLSVPERMSLHCSHMLPSFLPSCPSCCGILRRKCFHYAPPISQDRYQTHLFSTGKTEVTSVSSGLSSPEEASLYLHYLCCHSIMPSLACDREDFVNFHELIFGNPASCQTVSICWHTQMTGKEAP